MSGPDRWSFLKEFTAARIALGRTGNALPTENLLDFQMAHAQARDAVHASLDMELLHKQIADTGIGLPVAEVNSEAPTRHAYLQDPSKGRHLSPDAELPETSVEHDLVFIIGDGLSATAVHENAVATLAATLTHLEGWTVAPLVIAHQARVALADEIGARFHAALSVMLIGERPGLSASDSLGAYLTFAPKPGRQNAERNCVSNIRPAGLRPELAGYKIAWLLKEARRLKLTGVNLKDDAPDALPGRQEKSRGQLS